MSSGVVRELVTMWGFDINEKPLAKLDAKIGALKTSFVHLGAFIFAETGALFAMAHSTAEAGHEVEKTSQKVGINVQKLQELQYAAKMADVEVESMTTGLRLMAKHSFDASRGNESASSTFRMLGVNIRDSNGALKTSDVLLLEVSDSFKNLKDPIAKTAIAQQLFGRGGLAMIPLLNQGSAKIKELSAEAHKYGVVLNDGAIRQADRFMDGIKHLQAMLLGLRNTIGVALMPVITKLMGELEHWFMVNRKLITQQVTTFIKEIAHQIINLLPVALRMLGIVTNLVEKFGGLSKILKVVAAAMVGWTAATIITSIIGLVQAIMAVAAAFTTMGVAEAFASGGLSLIAGAAAAALAGGIAYGIMGGSGSQKAAFQGGPSHFTGGGGGHARIRNTVINLKTGPMVVNTRATKPQDVSNAVGAMMDKQMRKFASDMKNNLER